MKILTLHIEDFLSIGRAKVELNDVGLCLVQGCNEDNPSASSNGAGKSSVVDAISYCLYGETARGIGADAIIRHGQKMADVVVQLLDEATGIVYDIMRTRRKAKGTLSLFQIDPLTKASIDLTLGTEKLTQDAINKVLGCSREVFMASVCLAQEHMPDLPMLTDRKLKELIEEAAGVGILEAAYLAARERGLVAEKAELAGVAKVAGIEARLADKEATLERLDGETTIWLAGRAAAYAALQQQIDEADAEAVRLRGEMADAAKVATWVDLIAAIDLSLKSFAAQQAQERSLQSALTVAERNASSKEATARIIIEQAKDAAKFTVGTVCEACEQPLDEVSVAASVNAHKARADSAKGSARDALQRFTEAKLGVTSAQETLASHRAAMGDPTALQAERWVLSDLVKAHEKVCAALERVNFEIGRLTSECVAVTAATSPHLPMMIATRKEAEDLEMALAKARSETAELTHSVAVMKSVIQVFGPAGVRAHVLDQVTPYLNERTSAYLDMLSDGTLKAVWSTLTRNAKGELKEKFAIEVTHPAGEGFGGLSGGEKRKVRIACAFALQDLVASRATKPFKLLVLDEVDDALDEAGLERLMAVLNDKAKERGSVLVISHRSLVDWIPNVITVTKKDGVSTVEVA